MKINIRKVNVYTYFSYQGFWYFSGLDVEKGEMRTFRCDRIQGDLSISNKSQAYVIPEDFKRFETFGEKQEFLRATLRLRIGRGSQLRSMSISTKSDNEHDLVEIEYSSEKELVSLILWHLDDVEVISPNYLKQRVISSLESLVNLHG
jgi:proteasome accessory factor B